MRRHHGGRHSLVSGDAGEIEIIKWRKLGIETAAALNLHPRLPPFARPIGAQHALMLGAEGEKAGIGAELATAQQGEDARHVALSLYRDEVELEHRITAGESLGRLADDDRHAVILRFSFEPRGEIDGVAEHRIFEVLFPAKIADDAVAGVDADA